MVKGSDLAIPERGMDPEAVIKEIADSNDKLDKLGIILDNDPRNTTQAGLPRIQAQGAPLAPDDPGGTTVPQPGDPEPTPVAPPAAKPAAPAAKPAAPAAKPKAKPAAKKPAA